MGKELIPIEDKEQVISLHKDMGMSAAAISRKVGRKLVSVCYILSQHKAKSGGHVVRRYKTSQRLTAWREYYNALPDKTKAEPFF